MSSGQAYRGLKRPPQPTREFGTGAIPPLSPNSRQIASVGDSELKLYFLVGEPSQADLKPVYRSALNILKKASSSAEVFSEADAATLSLRLAVQVAEHEANAAHA